MAMVVRAPAPALLRGGSPVVTLVGALVVTLVGALVALAGAASAQTVPVRLVNASRPTLCAEEDNVDIRLRSAHVTRFGIAAVLPAYHAAMTRDLTAPDFTHCDMSGDPRFAFDPRSVVLWEDDRLALVGHAFATNWRPERVDTVVGDRVERGLHLLQLFDKTAGPRTEYLVLYPSDGYWRLKPLPPPGRPETAYGSSFLVGPVEDDGRPLVRLERVAFEPAERRFRLAFAAGGSATLTVEPPEPGRAAVTVALDRPAGPDRPFAALRSMFVAADNADVAEAAVVGTDGGARTHPVLARGLGDAVSVRFGRSVPSRHNTSAPDLIFGPFAGP